MKRKIKFKAKRLGNGEWVEGDLIHKNNGVYVYNPQIVNKRGYSVQSIKVDSSTVCQFTGLNDCEGNEIWEGDIVRDTEDFLGINNLYEVVYIEEEGSFAFKSLDKVDNYEPFVNLFKTYVVGNKFDKEK